MNESLDDDTFSLPGARKISLVDSATDLHYLAFIRGLLENVGAEIDPIRIVRRIKNGLEIPGLKGALIKILQDFNLQVSLLEGCQTILHGDSADLALKLHRNQTSGFFLNGVSLVISYTRHPNVLTQNKILVYFLFQVCYQGWYRSI